MNYSLSPEAHQTLVDRAFEAATRRAAKSIGLAPPFPVHTAAIGEPFVRDSDPHALLMRAHANEELIIDAPLMPRGSDVCVVVIAVSDFNGKRKVGEVFYMPARETVRSARIVQPLRVEVL